MALQGRETTMTRRILKGAALAIAGIAFALTLVVTFAPDAVRQAWAAGAQLLYSSAQVDGSAFTAGTDAVQAVGGLDAAGNLNVASPTDPFPVATPAGASVDVNLIEVLGTATNVNGGNRDAGTQTTTLADNDPAVVDLAAIEVLQTTIAGDTTSLDGKITVGGGAEAGAVLVTVANDSTGLVSVDDGASSLTVDLDGLTVGGTSGDATPVDGVRIIGKRVDVATEYGFKTIATTIGDNPGSSVQAVGAMLYGWDGSNYDQVRIDGDDGPLLARAPGNSVEQAAADAQLNAGSAGELTVVSVVCGAGGACDIAVKDAWGGAACAGSVVWQVGAPASSTAHIAMPDGADFGAAACVDTLASGNVASWSVAIR